MRCVTYSRKYNADEGDVNVDRGSAGCAEPGKVNVNGNKNAAVIENGVVRCGN